MNNKKISMNHIVDGIMSLDSNDYNLQMLGRLVEDVKYFLGVGRYNCKHLWGLNPKDHIKKRWEIYNKLPFEPEWCTGQDIRLFDEAMLFRDDSLLCLNNEAKVHLWDYLDMSFVGEDEETDLEKERHKQWFLDKMLPKGFSEQNVVYIVFIGGKPVDYIHANSILAEELIKINNSRRF